MSEIQKLMGLEFLKHKVNNLEDSLEYKYNVVIDVTGLLFGLDVLKRWINEKTHLILIPIHSINSLDWFKQSDNADIQHKSRSASGFIEKELKRGTIKLQQSIALTNNHYNNIINSLKLTSNQSKLVVARCNQSIAPNDRINVDEVIKYTEQSGYSVDLLLPAEIEDAKLWSKQRKLRYLNKKKDKGRG